MRVWGLAAALALCAPLEAQTALTLRERAREFLIELIRRDTTNPPGNETRVAEYLKQVAASYGIEADLLGDDPARMNFVARLKGSGQRRPLLLMAHSDVVPAEREHWEADPFGAEIRDGRIYGRGAVDDKNLLAAELAVLVELKVRGIRLKRDIILLSESDEESASSGIQWMIRNAWDRIDAEAALNEGGYIQSLPSKTRIFGIQTTEKIPTRVILTAHGPAGHASLPLPDNAVLRLSRALLRLDAEQPVSLNATTRRYLQELAKLGEYSWLAPLVPSLDSAAAQADAAAQIRSRNPELDAQLRTTATPTVVHAGVKINVIPSVAEAQIDVRRVPQETAEEVVARLRRIVRDDAIEVQPANQETMPAVEPSSIASEIYRTMERVLAASDPRAVVVPMMSRGATDGAYLRRKGMVVYGVPLFAKEEDNRAHGNNERISVANLDSGVELLWAIVRAVGE